VGIRRGTFARMAFNHVSRVLLRSASGPVGVALIDGIRSEDFVEDVFYDAIAAASVEGEDVAGFAAGIG
jgi:hypothetical protein